MRLLVLAALLAAPPAQAQMYKCVDERGVTSYSDKARPNCKGGEVDIGPIPPISGKVTPYREDLKAAEQDFQRRQSESAGKADAEAKAREEQKRRCASLQSELQRYGNQRRIPTVDAKGERTFMDADARDAKVAQLNAEIAQKCR